MLMKLLASASLGLDIRASMQRTLESISLWPLAGGTPSRPALMPVQSYQSMVQNAQRALEDERIKPYCYV